LEGIFSTASRVGLARPNDSIRADHADGSLLECRLTADSTDA
jgi:hypothetical protein